GRLYRGMHHPTDIVGAYLNGIASITIAATSVLGRGRRRGDGGPDPSPPPVTTGATGMTA
ncbi:MAG: hypothetical protein LH461_11060, partial [Spirochaetaceae bacterium]|nr:hypothetical protein [Spirochaetaceae bacterium]